jgi:HSP20 family molecular chaperone IbpA
MTNELKKTDQNEVTRRDAAERTYVPAADIWETEEAIVIKLDMPGVSKDNMDIQINRDTLTVSGQMDAQPQGGMIYGEQRIGAYYREFSLSDDLDHDTVSADMNAGVLTLQVGKAQRLKPRKIEIASFN